MMGLKKYFVSGYRLNDENEKYPDDEKVYLSADVDQVLTIAKDRFAELDNKYTETRAALAKVNARLEVAKVALERISDNRKSDLIEYDSELVYSHDHLIDKSSEALAKLKEME